MSRAVRITVGSVLVGVLAFVALVAGTMSATSGWDGGDLFGDPADAYDTPGTAEVLDVDDYGDGWPAVDVRFTTPDGEVVVTYLEWEWADELPELGDDVDIVYDDTDPEFAVAAADPWLQDGDPPADAVPGTDRGATAQVAGWVALAALLGVLVGAVVTVVAAVRAPAPARHEPVHVPGPYEAPHPYLVGPAPQPGLHPHPQGRWVPQPGPAEASPSSRVGDWSNPG